MVSSLGQGRAATVFQVKRNPGRVTLIHPTSTQLGALLGSDLLRLLGNGFNYRPCLPWNSVSVPCCLWPFCDLKQQ